MREVPGGHSSKMGEGSVVPLLVGGTVPAGSVVPLLVGSATGADSHNPVSGLRVCSDTGHGSLTSGDCLVVQDGKALQAPLNDYRKFAT